ncbi:MAG: hypothetical protein JNM14_05835 [Ferruginibacter sp.]|nr:hypothetical protein [Ferruginibacter sp.]
MKKLLLFILNFCFVAAMGQNLIAPISITLPASPPANTAEWATAMPPVMIMAQTKLRNGQVPGEVVESRILVTIKSGGNKVCGSYTQQTAPGSNFNSVTKTWNGAAVLSLLGQSCILKPGTYELCVQFYNLNPAAGNGVLGEACKSFTIEDTKQQTYSAPQNILPVNNKMFTQQEAGLPITFRWTPVLPKPKADVQYRVKVIEVQPGQNATVALRTNTPIEVLEVKNQTQASAKLAQRCNGCEYYIWNVEASKKSAMGDIEMLGTSEATAFRIGVDESNPGNCLALDTTKYTIACVGGDPDGKYRYRVQNLTINKVAGNPDPFIESGYIDGLGVSQNNNYILPVLPATGVVVQNILPASITSYTSSTSAPISFDFVSAVPLTSFTAKLTAYSYHLSASGSKIHCQKNFEITFDVPPCSCNICESVKLNFGQETKAQQNNYVTIQQPLSTVLMPGNSMLPIKSISAEIVYFDIIKSDSNCYKCEKDSRNFGKFSTVTLANNSFSSTGTLPGGEVIFNTNNPQALTNTNMNFTVTAPDLLKCCTDKINVCIWYTITTADCKTCNAYRCYEISRIK